MTTAQRPILGSDAATPREPAAPAATARPASAPEMLIARDLPAWDLLPSDLLVVRRRVAKK